MRLGSLQLESNLFLAPLAGYTNLPFRLVARGLGGIGLATTDLLNARSLLERRPKALKIIETAPGDKPLAVQLFGAVLEEMRDAALYLESLGVAAIDINMGCPARKVCRVGGGSAMMMEWGKTARLAAAIVKAVRIPVTAKMRLGWDDNNITAPDLARSLEAVGIAGVFVHGRTREQGFSGRVNLAGIATVVAAVQRIPVIGNGDVVSPQAARKMIDETGCVGVSIGRGAFYNPWIFQQTLEYFRNGETPPEPSFEERVRVMSCHLQRMVEIFGETQGCRMFRKIAPWYMRQAGPAREFNRRIVQLSNQAEFVEIIEQCRSWRQQFLDEKGRLKPRFQPSPVLASFECEPGRKDSLPAIPASKGPVELW